MTQPGLEPQASCPPGGRLNHQAFGEVGKPACVCICEREREGGGGERERERERAFATVLALRINIKFVQRIADPVKLRTASRPDNKV